MLTELLNKFSRGSSEITPLSISSFFFKFKSDFNSYLLLGILTGKLSILVKTKNLIYGALTFTSSFS